MVTPSTDRRRRTSALLGIACTIALAPAASAADWYVDANAAPGGNGSAASPFQTIGKALSSSVDGDRIFVAAATYGERIAVAASVTILCDRAGGTTLDAGGAGTAITIASGKSVWLQDLRVTGGLSSSTGGGILNSGSAVLVRCNVVNCSSVSYGIDASGGGIENDGSLLLWSCTVDSCAVEARPLIFPFTICGNAAGGGIFNTGNLKIFDSTISANQCYGEMYVARRRADGGGIANGGSLRLVNATVSGNSCRAAIATCGGIWSSTTSVVIDHSTIAANGVLGHDLFGGGVAGVGGFGGSSARVGHSIFDQNGGWGDLPGAVGGDFAGTCDSLGYVLIFDDSGTTYTGDTTGMQKGVSAVLLALADNGGPVRTHALGPTSPCIDAGNPDAQASPPYDARGYPRALWDPAVGASDLGAYEAGSSPTYLLTATPDVPLPAGATLELVTGGGVAAKPVALTVVAMNGTPTFLPMLITTFDQSGVLVVVASVPSGLSGFATTLRSYSLDANDRVVVTPTVDVHFQ
ncbi:MAG TPA: choice-of-anchor Q domain-containing protein [Planctomycetota bacterium]|nr:choice-of-anchor Q domain-containing protein [Planctomycetota bacterium]